MEEGILGLGEEEEEKEEEIDEGIFEWEEEEEVEEEKMEEKIPGWEEEEEDEKMKESIPGLGEEPRAISPKIPVGARVGPAPDGYLCAQVHPSLYTANNTLFTRCLLRGGNYVIPTELNHKNVGDISGVYDGH